MSIELFKPYYLAGGTALALQIGHRESYDLDLFGKLTIPHELTLEELKKLGEVFVKEQFDNVSRFEVNQIKVDLVKYRYDLLKPLVRTESIRMASIEDIAAMKIYAIISRGAKRDFFDLYTLMEKFSLDEMITLTKIKYPENTELHTIRSLTFFDDAEEEEDPKMFYPVSWESVKDKIKAEIKRIVL